MIVIFLVRFAGTIFIFTVNTISTVLWNIYAKSTFTKTRLSAFCKCIFNSKLINPQSIKLMSQPQKVKPSDDLINTVSVQLTTLEEKKTLTRRCEVEILIYFCSAIASKNPKS